MTIVRRLHFLAALLLAACATASSKSVTADGASASAASNPTAAGRPAGLDVNAGQPPVAKKEPHESVFHGDKVNDDYYWLKKKGTPEVEAYLNAENAYTAAVMKPTAALQETLYQELLGRIQQTDLSVPARRDGYYYYSRTEEGKQYPIFCRKAGDLKAPEEVYLDVNELAKGEKFMQVGQRSFTDDGAVLAYSVDNTGYRQYTLRFKDLGGKRDLPETMERVTSTAWAADGKTLFYTVEDPVAKRSYRLYRHALGTPSAQDALLYEEKDERFGVQVSKTRSKRFLILSIGSHTTSEDRLLPAAEPQGEFKTVEPRAQDHQYYVDDGLDGLYIRTNSGGRNFRLVKAPVGNAARAQWLEVVPHREDVMLADFDVFADQLALHTLEDGIPHLRLIDRKTGKTGEIPMPEPVRAARLAENYDYAPKVLRYVYQSPTTPESVLEHDLATGQQQLLKRTAVLGGFNPNDYAVERLHAAAADGAQIPVSVVYKKGTPRDGSAPLFLYAYGSYGNVLSVGFSSNGLSLLNRGITMAFAHIRGGGDLGKKWHDQGRMMNKKNTFTDFVASAEHLIAQKYTQSDRLVIEGGSAGGLLMGAVANLRPDLFKAVIALVPFVDVINTMSDETLPLTVGEFEEWGNPKVKEQYEYMRSYSPYENVTAKAYPDMLVRTAYNDSQVMYWEPAKYVAKLRANKTDKNLLIFKCTMEPGGHGGKSGRYERLREVAFDYAFILSEVGAAGK